MLGAFHRRIHGPGELVHVTTASTLWTAAILIATILTTVVLLFSIIANRAT